MKELDLLFYGNTRIPLSADCSGCHHFNYICEGSVYRGECPAGLVEDIKDSLIAFDILEEEILQGNHYKLMRINGFNLEEEDFVEHIQKIKDKVEMNKNNPHKKEYVRALTKSLEDYYAAKDLEEDILKNLKEKFLSDAYNPKTYSSEETKIELKKDDDLPF